MHKDFVTQTYYFRDKGSVDFTYRHQNNRFEVVFTNDVDNSDKEWMSRVCARMNEYVIAGHSPLKISLEFTKDDKTNKITVYTRSKDAKTKLSFIADYDGNIFNAVKGTYVQLKPSIELMEIYKRIKEIANEQEVDIVLDSEPA